MLLKTRQIVVTLNLDCLCRIGLNSDRIPIVSIAFLMLTDKPTFLPTVWCTKLFEEVMSSHAASFAVFI